MTCQWRALIGDDPGLSFCTLLAGGEKHVLRKKCFLGGNSARMSDLIYEYCFIEQISIFPY